jgi:hypothetical protein
VTNWEETAKLMEQEEKIIGIVTEKLKDAIP